MIMCIQNLVSICIFVLKILSKNQILTSIKGRYSDANLQKAMIYYTNIDLVNDNVYIYIQNLALIGLFLSKILSKNLILKWIKGRNSVANLPKFELIQAFMHVLVTCNNEEDPIKNEGARVIIKISPIISLWGFFQTLKGS